MCAEWVRRGYKITVLTGIPNYPYGRYFDGYGLFKSGAELYGMDIIRIPLIARGKSAVGMCLNYISLRRVRLVLEVLHGAQGGHGVYI